MLLLYLALNNFALLSDYVGTGSEPSLDVAVTYTHLLITSTWFQDGKGFTNCIFPKEIDFPFSRKVWGYSSNYKRSILRWSIMNLFSFNGRPNRRIIQKNAKHNHPRMNQHNSKGASTTLRTCARAFQKGQNVAKGYHSTLALARDHLFSLFDITNLQYHFWSKFKIIQMERKNIKINN